MPVRENREYRNLNSVEAIENQNESQEFIVEGYATTFNSPYELYRYDDTVVNEQVDSAAFDKCDCNDVILQYDHEGRVFARTSNKTLELIKDEHGLKVRAYLGGTEIGKQLYSEIKGGYITKMSFGFIVDDDKVERLEENGQTTVLRTIKSISKLYDVSAVSIPANDQTQISARKFGDGVINEIKQELAEKEQVERAKQRIRILIELNK